MVNGAVQKPAENGPESAVVRALGNRSIVLVGMMGAGKSSIGRRLATDWVFRSLTPMPKSKARRA